MPKSLHFIATHKFTTFFSLSARNDLQKKITQKNLLRKLVLSAFSSFFFLSLVCIDQNTSKEMGEMKNPVYSMISNPRNEKNLFAILVSAIFLSIVYFLYVSKLDFFLYCATNWFVLICSNVAILSKFY